MNLAGAIAVVTVNDNADNAIYTAIKVQDANVTASTGTDTFGLDGQLDITKYDSNSAADGYDRLDWTNAFEGGVIWNPGANLPTPANLDIDFTSDMHYRVAGTVSGDPGNGNTILTAGDVNVTGTFAEFAVSKYDRDLDNDPNTNEPLNSYAFNLTNAGFSVLHLRST